MEPAKKVPATSTTSTTRPVSPTQPSAQTPPSASASPTLPSLQSLMANKPQEIPMIKQEESAAVALPAHLPHVLLIGADAQALRSRLPASVTADCAATFLEAVLMTSPANK